MTQKIFAIGKTHTVKNQPYRITAKTEARCSIEFKKNTGFRSVFQTMNPATKEWTTPQRSTYSSFAYAYLNQDRHIAFKHYDLKTYEDVNILARFIAKHFDDLQLTGPMIAELYNTLYKFIKGSIASSILSPVLETISKGKSTGANVFSEINLDLTAIRQLEIHPEQQPH